MKQRNKDGFVDERGPERARIAGVLVRREPRRTRRRRSNPAVTRRPADRGRRGRRPHDRVPVRWVRRPLPRTAPSNGACTTRGLRRPDGAVARGRARRPGGASRSGPGERAAAGDRRRVPGSTRRPPARRGSARGPRRLRPVARPTGTLALDTVRRPRDEPRRHGHRRGRSRAGSGRRRPPVDDRRWASAVPGPRPVRRHRVRVRGPGTVRVRRGATVDGRRGTTGVRLDAVRCRP